MAGTKTTMTTGTTSTMARMTTVMPALERQVSRRSFGDADITQFNGLGLLRFTSDLPCKRSATSACLIILVLVAVVVLVVMIVLVVSNPEPEQSTTS